MTFKRLRKQFRFHVRIFMESYSVFKLSGRQCLAKLPKRKGDYSTGRFHVYMQHALASAVYDVGKAAQSFILMMVAVNWARQLLFCSTISRLFSLESQAKSRNI